MKAKMISKTILSVWILFFLFLFVGVKLNVAQADTFIVTTTADTDDSACDADCSLREAIVAANANVGHDAIHFAIPAAGVQTIKPDPTPLDPITDPVTIDGYTQCFSPNSCAAVATASSPATILIEISGEKTAGNGLTLGNGSSGSTIRGLSINRFTRSGGGTGHAITIGIPPSTISDSNSNWIAGNYLNVAPDGHTVFPGPWGAGLNEGGKGNNIIGHDPSGPNYANPAADRNVISGAGIAEGLFFNGIQIFFPVNLTENIRGNTIRGNYIGTDASGTQALGNPGLGIRSERGDGIIEGNLISGNGVHGIGLTPTAGNNLIRGNKIGTDVTGTVDLGNSTFGILLLSGNNTIEDNLISGNNQHGIFTQNNSGNLIRGNRIGTDVTGTLPIGNSDAGISSGVAMGFSSNNRVVNNVIAFNSSNGVGIVRNNSVSNVILSNSIFGNGDLGIDLIDPFPAGTGQVNLNDPLDVDLGPNNLQNFPVLDGQRSIVNPALVEIRGELDSKPNRDYLIQIFSSVLADPSDHGEGQKLVGEVVVTTDDSGHAEFCLADFDPQGHCTLAVIEVPVGRIISATATDLLTNDTSEFSRWVKEAGSPTAYENAAGAAGGDGLGDMSWEELGAEQP